MADTLTHNWGPTAASGVAPAVRWSADATSPACIRHRHSVIAPVPSAYEVKQGFNGTTRRPTEGST
ncbi:hypothetical protein BH23ACT2_BH23ACT2_11160 [soil metagenome]